MKKKKNQEEKLSTKTKVFILIEQMLFDDDDDDDVLNVFVKQMSVHRYWRRDIVAYVFLNLDVIWIFSDNVHIRNFE